MVVQVIAVFIAKTAASKLAGYAMTKVLGVELEERTLGQWTEQAVLGVFFGKGLVPDQSFEQKVESRFAQLDARIDQLQQDLSDLRSDLEAFEWSVDTRFLEDDEEENWRFMGDYDNDVERYYADLRELQRSTAGLERKQERAREIARAILASQVPTNVRNARDRILGRQMGVENERVKGFLEIWFQQALREMDRANQESRLGWDGPRLVEVYGVLEKKFTQVLLMQMRGVRLLMEAHSARHAEDPSEQSPLDFYLEQVHPMLVEEVEAFRRMIESLAVNLLPFPPTPLAALEVPAEIAGMLGAVDYLAGQALSGRISDQTPPLYAAAGREPADLPALAGCWGRVLVPGRRWIGRKDGSSEPARLRVTGGPGQGTVLQGTLQVRDVQFKPYDGRHQGYTLYVATEPRKMDRLLLAHFVPSEVLPAGLSGSEVEVRLEDAQGGTLTTTKATLVTDGSGDAEGAAPSPAAFGTFTTTFTGGAEVRALTE